jgi:O-antigen/teichoic acid export membrane protein
MYFEIIAVGFSFAFTSLYWLICAFKMTATDYGHMMQIQAFMLIVTAICSLRTHDLVFYLHKSHSLPLHQSFNLAQTLEFVLVAISATSTFLISALINWSSNTKILSDDIFTSVLISFIANVTLLQGASLAYLRAQHLDANVAWSDLINICAWGVALTWLIRIGEPSIIEVLGVAFTAAALKPLSLLIISRIFLLFNPSQIKSSATNLDRRSIGYFLLAGQLANTMKNGMTSIETLIVGRLLTAESVAVFRIARSFLGLTTALLNISYQKTFRELVKVKEKTELKKIIRLMNKSSLKLWALSVPIIIIASFLFTLINKNIIYNQLPEITLITALAYLPIALQQTSYARLSLEASFHGINKAYIIGLAVLLLTCLITTTFITLPIFLFIVMVANFSRLWVMSAFANKLPH